MSRTTIQKIYSELKPELIYEASKKALTDLGHEVYKQRPFAYLVEARTTTEEGLVLANMIVNAFTKEFSLVVKSETASQENVDDIANNILKAFEENLRS